MSTDSHTAADVPIPSPDPETLEASISKIEAASVAAMDSGDRNPESTEAASATEEMEEEEGECGFCLYMKGGGCKDSFVAWEQCVEAVEQSGKRDEIAEKCFEMTVLLKKCMEEHADYYEPVLKAEKAAEEMVEGEIEKERMKEGVAVIEVEKEKESGDLAAGASSSSAAAAAGSGKQEAAAT